MKSFVSNKSDVQYIVTTLLPIPTEETNSVDKSGIKIIDEEEAKSMSECSTTKGNSSEEHNEFLDASATSFDSGASGSEVNNP